MRHSKMTTQLVTYFCIFGFRYTELWILEIEIEAGKQQDLVKFEVLE